MAAEHEENFKEMELWEHLAELRGRMIRSIIYVVVGMTVAWVYYDWLWRFLMAPMNSVAKTIQFDIAFRHITDAFMAQLQISLVAGVVLALPLVTLEGWGFVAPGLTRTEKRAFYICVPLSLFFFALGLVTGYLILPAAFAYFAGFFANPGGTPFHLLQDPMQYILFVIKMEAAFGLVFQLPVVLMFLGYVGIVSSQLLKQQWRAALVICSVVAAVATPSNDAISMLMMAAPLCLLYLASIWLVAFVERIRERRYRPRYDA